MAEAHAHEPDESGSTTPPSPHQPAGLDPKIGGLLSYLLFGWIGGLIMFLTQSDREVRFHGMQSILYSVALLAIFIGLGVISTIVGFVPGLGIVSGFIGLALYPLVWLASVALWIVLCVKGYQLAHFKLPLVGDYAEQFSGYHSRPA